MKILAISNLKGGVGKSTIAQNIAAQFAQNGVKVCIADTDTEQKTSVKWASLRDSSLVSIPVFSGILVPTDLNFLSYPQPLKSPIHETVLASPR